MRDLIYRAVAANFNNGTHLIGRLTDRKYKRLLHKKDTWCWGIDFRQNAEVPPVRHSVISQGSCLKEHKRKVIKQS